MCNTSFDMLYAKCNKFMDDCKIAPLTFTAILIQGRELTNLLN